MKFVNNNYQSFCAQAFQNINYAVIEDCRYVNSNHQDVQQNYRNQQDNKYMDTLQFSTSFPNILANSKNVHGSQSVASKSRRSGKRKRVRTAFTSEQLIELEREFAIDNKLSPLRRFEISKRLKLNERPIKFWFQNRRMKEKKRVLKVSNYESPTTKQQRSTIASTIVNSSEEGESVEKLEDYFRNFRECATPTPDLNNQPACYHLSVSQQPTPNINNNPVCLHQRIQDYNINGLLSLVDDYNYTMPFTSVNDVYAYLGGP